MWTNSFGWNRTKCGRMASDEAEQDADDPKDYMIKGVSDERMDHNKDPSLEGKIDRTKQSIWTKRRYTRSSRRSSTWRTKKNILPLCPKLVVSKQCNSLRGILVICKI